MVVTSTAGIGIGRRRRPGHSDDSPSSSFGHLFSTKRYGVKCAFGLMVGLFFLNTFILLYHVDQDDMFQSIKSRLEFLKESVPFVKEVRDVVTDHPNVIKAGLQNVRNQNKNEKSSRAADGGDHVARREFLIESQQHKSGSQNLRAFGKTSSNYEFEWSELTGSTSFRLLDSSTKEWAEFHDGKPKFKFKERKMTKEKNERTVELYDEDRRMTILLLERQSLFKQEGRADFVVLYQGYWSMFEGVADKGDVGNYGDIKPPPTYMEGSQDEQTIVVMLAAYRDPLCPNTIYEAFTFAKHPERISVIVIQQNHESDPDCLEEYCQIASENGKPCYKDRVIIDRVPLDHARGVMPARYRQNLLIQDQEFCLQIDSHSAFEDNWDVLALEDWESTENEMAVITAYPNMVRDRHDQRHTPHRCSTKWGTDKQVVHGGNSALNVRPGKTPHLIPFFGAGTVFSKCHANYNVPYDGYMSHLFGGEEFNRAIRLWTTGYDMYGPRRNFVYHYYDADEKPPRGKEPRHREFFHLKGDQKKIMRKQTTARWRSILGLPLTSKSPILSELAMQDSEYYGIGSRRRIEQYETFAQVNLRAATAKSSCDLLGRMKWQAYKFDSPFYPAGSKCPYRLSKDIRKYCCTTLAQIKDNTINMLETSNENLAQKIKESLTYTRPDELSPIISPLNSNAYEGECIRKQEVQKQEEREQQEEEQVNQENKENKEQVKIEDEEDLAETS